MAFINDLVAKMVAKGRNIDVSRYVRKTTRLSECQGAYIYLGGYHSMRRSLFNDQSDQNLPIPMVLIRLSPCVYKLGIRYHI